LCIAISGQDISKIIKALKKLGAFFWFYLKLVPAVRYIFLFLKKKYKGCRFHQG
jgi:hypothetical protein